MPGASLNQLVNNLGPTIQDKAVESDSSESSYDLDELDMQKVSHWSGHYKLDGENECPLEILSLLLFKN